MRTIHKTSFPLDRLTDTLVVSLPTGSEILSVGNQHETLVVWYKTDTDKKDHEKQNHKLRIATTGNPLGIERVVPSRFLGTVQFQDGAFVVHVFEIG